MKPWAMQMVNLFRLFQGGGMGGSSILPSAAMDEPVAMMDAFALMADFDAKQREENAPLYGEDGKPDEQAQADAVAEKLRARMMGG